MLNSQGLLDLAARFREFALQTAQGEYAAQMLRAATELETQAVSQRKTPTAQRRPQAA